MFINFFFITKSTAFFLNVRGLVQKKIIRKDTETLTQTNETHFTVIKTACICSFHKPLIKTSSSHEYCFITNSIEIYMTHIVILIQKAWLNRCFCCLAVSAGIKQKLSTQHKNKLLLHIIVLFFSIQKSGKFLMASNLTTSINFEQNQAHWPLNYDLNTNDFCHNWILGKYRYENIKARKRDYQKKTSNRYQLYIYTVHNKFMPFNVLR